MLLGHLGERGLGEPGSFYAALIDAMMRADRRNLAKLENSFPDLAWAVRLYRFEPGGYPRLCALAGVALRGAGSDE